VCPQGELLPTDAYSSLLHLLTEAFTLITTKFSSLVPSHSTQLLADAVSAVRPASKLLSKRVQQLQLNLRHLKESQQHSELNKELQ
jgi:hypothetical protein